MNSRASKKKKLEALEKEHSDFVQSDIYKNKYQLEVNSYLEDSYVTDAYFEKYFLMMVREYNYLERKLLQDEKTDYTSLKTETKTAIAEVQGIRYAKQEDRIVNGHVEGFSELSKAGREIALRETVKQLADDVRKHDFVRDNGSAFSLVVSLGSSVYTANVADSAVFTYCNKKLTRQTKILHNVKDIKNNPDEKEREQVRSRSNRNPHDPRLDTGLAVYRSIGDESSRVNRYAQELKEFNTPDIYVDELKIEEKSTGFIINACDGLTEKLSNEALQKIINMVVNKSKDAELSIDDFKEIWAAEESAEKAFTLTTSLLARSQKAEDHALELARMISATLVACAIVSGSTDNISVVVTPVSPEDKVAKYIGVFDGHGIDQGHAVSEYLEKNFDEVFEQQITLQLQKEAEEKEQFLKTHEAKDLLRQMSQAEFNQFLNARNDINNLLTKIHDLEFSDNDTRIIEEKLNLINKEIESSSLQQTKEQFLEKHERFHQFLRQVYQDLLKISKRQDFFDKILRKYSQSFSDEQQLVAHDLEKYYKGMVEQYIASAVNYFNDSNVNDFSILIQSVPPPELDLCDRYLELFKKNGMDNNEYKWFLEKQIIYFAPPPGTNDVLEYIKTHHADLIQKRFQMTPEQFGSYVTARTEFFTELKNINSSEVRKSLNDIRQILEKNREEKPIPAHDFLLEFQRLNAMLKTAVEDVKKIRIDRDLLKIIFEDNKNVISEANKLFTIYSESVKRQWDEVLLERKEDNHSALPPLQDAQKEIFSIKQKLFFAFCSEYINFREKGLFGGMGFTALGKQLEKQLIQLIPAERLNKIKSDLEQIKKKRGSNINCILVYIGTQFPDIVMSVDRDLARMYQYGIEEGEKERFINASKAMIRFSNSSAEESTLKDVAATLIQRKLDLKKETRNNESKFEK
jgi:serine/threonine protein phosphatase PrpC